MTVQQALAAAGIDPREARLLLAEATGLPVPSLLAFPERALPDESARVYENFVQRRRAGEPVAYLLGRKEFYGLELEVTPAVLIPRPETELLVDLALERPFASALDLGTGSGAIALALKQHRPSARVVALDSSPHALDVARRNAMRHSLDIEFAEGAWMEKVEGDFDLIVSNPPYVAEGDPHLPHLRYEPREALVSGLDGLDAIREIARRAPRCLRPGGWLLLEHGMGQDAAVAALLREAGLESVATWPDLAGIGRVTGGRRKAQG